MGGGGDLVVVIGQINHFLAVRGNVREPGIHILVESQLGLLLAVGFHPPDLHPAGPHAVEPDVFPVRAIFGTIVQPGGVGEAGLFTALHRNGIDVRFRIHLTEGAVSQCLSVWADAMQVTGTCRGDFLRFAALEGNGEHERIVTPQRRIVGTDTKPFSVGGKDMVVVAGADASCRDFNEVRGSIRGDFEQATVLVDDQPLPVGRPVGSLDGEGELLDYLVGIRLQVIDFKEAVGGVRMLGQQAPAEDEGKEEGGDLSHILTGLGCGRCRRGILPGNG